VEVVELVFAPLVPVAPVELLVPVVSGLGVTELELLVPFSVLELLALPVVVVVLELLMLPEVSE
jgi:hypothetical protein